MSALAVIEGAIPPEGVDGLLGGLAQLGTTGVLEFENREVHGRVQLVRGQIADPDGAERRSVEALLSLRDGAFAVYPMLPHLPISRGTDSSRRGSLAVHSPADLMRYCEQAGLNGRLLLESKGKLAIGNYRAGQLEDVSIDGGSADDFVEALDWDEGTFRVDSVPPPPESLPPALRESVSVPAPDPTELPFVEAFEQGLAALGDTEEALSRAIERAIQTQDDPTLRVIRRPGEELPDLPPEAWSNLDYSPSQPGESATTNAVKSKDDGRPLGFRRTVMWISAVVLVLGACLWLLATLPPLE